MKEGAAEAEPKTEGAEGKVRRKKKTTKENYMQIYTFSPFGYEGSVITVEVDLRRGIPAVDMVGLADGSVRDARETVREAFKNSGLDFPPERVLVSLSPADLKKEGNSFSAAVAAAIRSADLKSATEDKVMVLGDLSPSGEVRPVRGVHAACQAALDAGITKVIVPSGCLEEALGVPGIEAFPVSSLAEISEALEGRARFLKKGAEEKAEAKAVEFDEELVKAAESVDLSGQYKAARALEIAAAGKHSVLLTGAPGCGKTLLTQSLLPALTPKLTKEEAHSVTRIHSLAGLSRPGDGLKRDAPFRSPHQTASIEGMCGGGPSCKPGEISLAHNGTLFLDEAAEFRSSVLQMLRVPLESGRITLARAGRTTVYPAKFQLAMAANPCPCGCLGTHGKTCLDSARSVELYWKKFSAPLLDRVAVKAFVEKDFSDERKITVQEMKERVAKAIEIQRERGSYNNDLSQEDVAKLCRLDAESQRLFEDAVRKNDLSPRMAAYAKKVALTIANMDGRTEIRAEDMKESLSYTVPIDPMELAMKKDFAVQAAPEQEAPSPEAEAKAPASPRAKEEVFADFAESVKERLCAADQKALDALLSAAKEALEAFPEEEKAAIGELLSKKGAKDGASLAKVLEKGTETKDKKRSREEGGRGM